MKRTASHISSRSLLLTILGVLLVWVLANSLSILWQTTRTASIVRESNQLAAATAATSMLSSSVFSFGPYIQFTDGSVAAGFAIGMVSNEALAAKKYPYAMQKNVRYGSDPAEVADICTPTVNYASAPGVILIHGGGWTSGDQTKLDDECETLASRGYVAMTIGYRLTSASSTLNHWPAQLQDVQLAARWLRANASTYKLDPTRICSWGESAGGHLAVFMGVQKTTVAGDRSNIYPDQSSSVSCVVDDFGIVDLLSLTGSHKRLATTLLGDVSDLKQAEKDASPVFLVNSSSAPTILFHGNADTVVDPAQSQELYNALKSAGVTASLNIFDGGHSFTGLTSDERDQIVEKSIRFIGKQIGSLTL